jgi:hypothetical protein
MGYNSKWLHYTSDTLSGFHRLRVDPAQTSFWEGREFRSFLEFSIPQGATQVIKATSTVDMVIFDINVSVDAGHLRLTLRSGGTEGGVFGTPMPVLPVNSMTAPEDRRKFDGLYHQPSLVVATGGTLTGGTIVDVIRLKTSDNSNFAGAVGSGVQSEIGVAPGTRYWVLENIGSVTCTGVIKSRFEERGPNSVEG